MTATMSGFLSEIMDGRPFPKERHPLLKDRHRTALELAVRQWGRELDEEDEHGRQSLRDRVKQAYKARLSDDGYGFAVITFLLVTVLAAAISWAVERLLTWLYPPKTGGMASAARIERLLFVRLAA